MESLSPLVRNSSVRRLSLELCQKIATNLLTTTPVKQLGSCLTDSSDRIKALSAPRLSSLNSNGSGRRASDVHFGVSTTGTSTSPNFSPSVQNGTRRASLTNYNWSPNPGSPFGRYSTNTSPFTSVISKFKEQIDQDVQRETPNSDRKRRKSSIAPRVTCHIIPPTPKRRSSLSTSISILTSPDNETATIKSKPNKENLTPSYKKRTKSSQFPFDLSISTSDFPSDFQLVPSQILGRGSFGTVLSAFYKGQEVAVKVLRLKTSPNANQTSTRSRGEDQLKGELNLLNIPQNKHIVSLIDIFFPKLEGSVCLILEKMDTNLLALVNDPEVTIDLRKVLNFSGQVASALVFLHEEGLLHLDVKPQNILVKGGWLKLSDFGNSRVVKEIKGAGKSTFSRLDGTVGYKAPELFRGERPSDKCDVYSFAVTMWQILWRQQPYLGETEHSVIYKVVAQNLRPKSVLLKPKGENHVESEFVSLYTQGWDGDQNKRPTMEQVHIELIKLLSLVN